MDGLHVDCKKEVRLHDDIDPVRLSEVKPVTSDRSYGTCTSKDYEKKGKETQDNTTLPRVLDSVSDRNQNHIFGTAPILQLYAQAGQTDSKDHVMCPPMREGVLTSDDRYKGHGIAHQLLALA
ncbi:hypothetical protein J6590_079480 [Homalodisca vitripennis]|nr:hypothetical protein J6590_079480 [Homalodisca vitripennis]